MIWALLALLGIPIWFIVVVLIGVFRSRRGVMRDSAVFEFKVRHKDGWSRSKSFGTWVSDVLIIRTGFALLRVDALLASEVRVLGTPEPVPKGLGEDAVELAVTFSDGGSLSIAVPTDDLDLSRGPYLGN